MKKQIGFQSFLACFAILLMTASGAFAEVVFNRGNSADPGRLIRTRPRPSTKPISSVTCSVAYGAGREGRASCPALQRVIRVSADGKIYTFKLRAGRQVVRWHARDRRMISSIHGAASSIRRPQRNMPTCWRRS